MNHLRPFERNLCVHMHIQFHWKFSEANVIHKCITIWLHLCTYTLCAACVTIIKFVHKTNILHSRCFSSARVSRVCCVTVCVCARLCFIFTAFHSFTYLLFCANLIVAIFRFIFRIQYYCLHCTATEPSGRTEKTCRTQEKYRKILISICAREENNICVTR